MILGQRARKEKEDLALLTSSLSGEMLRTALSAMRISPHRTLSSWSVHQVHHRPGAGISVGYKIVLSDHSDLYLVASTAHLDEAAVRQSGGATLSLGKPPMNATRVHLWEYPHDPELPALALACDSEALERLLGFPVNLELLSYRPTRRAVIRIEPEHTADFSSDMTAADIAPARTAAKNESLLPQTLYAKVLRPQAQADLTQRLKLLNDSGVPSPQLIDLEQLTDTRRPNKYSSSPLSHTSQKAPLSSDTSGLLMTSAASGMPLSRFYAAFKPNEMLQAEAMLDRIEHTLDSLPKTAMLFPRKPAWVDRCEHYAHAAGLAYPEGADRAHSVAQHIRTLLKQADLGEITAVHGDFYEANILIEPAAYQRDAYDVYDISSILDVDSLGPGYRVHDWACLLGHLAVLPSLAPSRYRYAQTLCSHWFDELVRRVDPVALCASTAGVILSLVAGAAKKRARNNDGGRALAESRLALAEEWAEAGSAILCDPYYSADIIQLRSRT